MRQETHKQQSKQNISKSAYGFELSDVVAVNDAFAVGRRQLEIIHSQTHVQQFPQVTCTKWILQEYSDTSFQYFHRFLIITLTFAIKICVTDITIH